MQSISGSRLFEGLAAPGFFTHRDMDNPVIGGMAYPQPRGIESLRDSLVMLVDDEPVNIDVVKGYLEEVGYHRFLSTSDSTQAISMAACHQPDVMLLDLIMPQVSGFDILASIRTDPALCHIPVVVLTSSTDASTKLRTLELGVTDFLNKPVDPSELILRLKNTLSAKAYQDHLACYSTALEHQVRVRTEQLEHAHRQIIHCLARAAEFRDDDTGKHVLRVGRYAAAIARQLGFDRAYVERLETAAQLHDVGKIGVPDSILHKSHGLDPHEYLLIQKHCRIGQSIINGQPEAGSWKELARHTEIGASIMGIPDTPIMKLAAVIAETHHEHWDGNGYPNRLRGEEIPIEGRITAVADVFDALTSKRTYKPALSAQESFRIIQGESEKHFDPRVVEAFLAATDEILQVQAELADGD